MDKTKMLILTFIIFAVIGSMAVIGGSMLAENTANNVNKSNQQIEEVANDLN